MNKLPVEDSTLPLLTPRRVALFWLRVKRVGHCWEYRGGRTTFGYGTIVIRKQVWLTHRLSWVLINGRAIPDGLFVLHRCDNPKCVNPDHLFLGTQRDNVQDMLQKERGFISIRHCRHGHAFTPENTNFDSRGFKICIECQRQRNRAGRAR